MRPLCGRSWHGDTFHQLSCKSVEGGTGTIEFYHDIWVVISWSHFPGPVIPKLSDLLLICIEGSKRWSSSMLYRHSKTNHWKHVHLLNRLPDPNKMTLAVNLARDSTKTVYFSRGESIGLTFDTLAGIASAVASLFILVLLFVSLISYRVDLFWHCPSVAYMRMGGRAGELCMSPSCVPSTTYI
jgi:hypothetical protein